MGSTPPEKSAERLQITEALQDAGNNKRRMSMPAVLENLLYLNLSVSSTYGADGISYTSTVIIPLAVLLLASFKRREKHDFQDQGWVMASCLLPSIYRGLSYGHEESSSLGLQFFALLSSLCPLMEIVLELLLSPTKRKSDWFWTVGMAPVAAITVACSTLFQNHEKIQNSAQEMVQIQCLFYTACFLVQWWILVLSSSQRYFNIVPFTRGEWMVFSSIVSLAVANCVWCLSYGSNDCSMHQIVALTGTVGACLSFVFVPKLSRRQCFIDTVWVEFMLLGVSTLGCVEFAVRRVQHMNGDHDVNASKKFYMLHCFVWLWHFLHEASDISVGTIQLQNYHWLVYWGFVLLITLTLANQKWIRHPSSSSSSLVVITRKWFHFIAVLLFWPVTRYAPDFMALSYAVAVSLLILLERIRHRIEWLQSFYDTFMDEKDKQAGASSNNETMVVTHLGLVTGCAGPLWISQLMSLTSSTTTRLPLVALPYIGIIVLGVGDAMGAIVGKLLGRTRWWPNEPTNRRTVEGSLAMFVSMFTCTFWLIGSHHDWQHQRVPLCLVFAQITLLEACTSQIDNICLPLAGASLLVVNNMILTEK